MTELQLLQTPTNIKTNHTKRTSVENNIRTGYLRNIRRHQPCPMSVSCCCVLLIQCKARRQQLPTSQEPYCGLTMTKEIYTSKLKGIWSPYLKRSTRNIINVLSKHINAEVSACMQKPIRLSMEHYMCHYSFGENFQKAQNKWDIRKMNTTGV